MTSTTTLHTPHPHAQRALSAQGHSLLPRSGEGHARNSSRSASHPPPGREYNRDSVPKDGNSAQRPEDIPPSNGIMSNLGHRPLEFASQSLRLADFELMQTLGTGTFARVWLARFAQPRNEKEGKQVFALKVLKKVDVIKLKQVEHVRNERNVLSAVAGYPFITKMLASFSDSSSLYMLLEYTPGGEIFSYLRRSRRFPLATVQFYAAEITLILAYLHDVHHVAYRDLKPENILLDSEGHLKLVDFGFAKYLPPNANPDATADQAVLEEQSAGEADQTTMGGQLHGQGITYTLCGTPEYLAPEVIKNVGHGTAVDWWALGILVYEMLIGQPPFWDQNPMRIYEQIVQGHIRFPVPSSHLDRRSGSLHVPRVAREFILALCTTDPSMRLGHIAGGSKRVMRHRFFEGVDFEAIYYRRRRGPIIPKVEWDGDAGNFDEYPDPDLKEGEESEAGRGRYDSEMREVWESAFADF